MASGPRSLQSLPLPSRPPDHLLNIPSPRPINHADTGLARARFAPSFASIPVSAPPLRLALGIAAEKLARRPRSGVPSGIAAGSRRDRSTVGTRSPSGP